MGLLTASKVFDEEIIKVSAGGTYDDVETPMVPEGHVLEVRHVAVENQTTSYTRLVIGRKRGGQFRQKEEEDNPTADDIYWTNSRMFISSRSTLCARMTGCTSGDVLVLTVEGILYKVGD